MWPKKYRDYPVDEPLIQEKVHPSRGIVGCEMHELNGWGHKYAMPRRINREAKEISPERGKQG